MSFWYMMLLQMQHRLLHVPDRDTPVFFTFYGLRKVPLIAVLKKPLPGLTEGSLVQVQRQLSWPAPTFTSLIPALKREPPMRSLGPTEGPTCVRMLSTLEREWVPWQPRREYTTAISRKGCKVPDT